MSDLIDDVARTSTGLRAALFDELDRIRKGESDAKRANAIVRISDGIIRIVKMDLEVQKHISTLPVGRKPVDGVFDIPGTVNLGAHTEVHTETEQS